MQGSATVRAYRAQFSEGESRTPPAIASRHVLPLQGLPERHGNQPQNLITCRVFVGVVERLEMVDVYHQQGEGFFPNPGASHGFDQCLVKVLCDCPAQSGNPACSPSASLQALLKLGDLVGRASEAGHQTETLFAHLERGDCKDLHGGQHRRPVVGSRRLPSRPNPGLRIL